MSERRPFKKYDSVLLVQDDNGIAAGSVGTVVDEGPAYPVVLFQGERQTRCMDPRYLVFVTYRKPSLLDRLRALFGWA